MLSCSRIRDTCPPTIQRNATRRQTSGQISPPVSRWYATQPYSHVRCTAMRMPKQTPPSDTELEKKQQRQASSEIINYMIEGLI